MKPLKLKLAGFAGVRSGLGRHEVELDFSRLAGDARLVAIVGPNGSGKSTILDNMQPYRLMPSRATGLTPGSFSYYEHLSSPEALKELEWEHDGRVFRSTLVLRAGKRRSAEAYLHERVDGAWAPAKTPDGTVSDGKTETYDRVLESVLGAPEAFFTSVFSAQNRRPLSAYTNAEIKALLADLLGISRILEIGAKASETARLIAARLEGARPSAMRVKALAEELPKLEEALREAERRQAEAEKRKAAASAALEAAREKLAAAKAAEQAAQATETARKRFSERADEARKACREALEAAAKDEARERARIARAKADLGKAREFASKAIAEAEAKIAEKRKLLSRADEIRSAKASLEALREGEAKARAALEALHGKARERAKLEAARAATAERLRAIEREGKHAAARLEDLRRRAKLAGEVPCAGTDLQPKCRLLKDALEAARETEAAEKRVEEMRAEWKRLSEEDETLAKAIAAFGDLEAMTKEAERSVKEASEKTRRATDLAALESGLSEAESAIRALEEFVSGQKRTVEEMERAAARETSEAEEALSAVAKRRAAAEEALKEALDAIEREAQELPPPFDRRIVHEAEEARAARERDLATAEEERSAAEKSRHEIAARIEAAKAEIASAEPISQAVTRMEEEIPFYRLLSKAFGADGIVALSIDDAGPEIAGLVNDLLLACFGPRFTVSIRTQVETAKGDLREGFAIEVFDSERGEAKPVSVMSGGERVWVNEALTRGIALYAARSGGRGYGTLFTDEADGPLDPVNKRRFIDMKRKVLELGGYEREYFVSQTPELWSMADVVIDLSAV